MGFRESIKKVFLQGVAEGSRSNQDPLTPPVASTTSKEVRKNNFTTYSSQIEQIYDGYNAESEYSSDLIRPAIDIRTALVCGDGISVSGKKNVEKFVNQMLDDNKFYGSHLLRGIEISEKEGKCLLLITKKKVKDKTIIRLKPIAWRYKKYTIITDEEGDIKGLKWGEHEQRSDTEIDLTPDKFVYVLTGSQHSDINITQPRIANILTQIENYDRALYDFRENNHLYGRTTPYFETEDQSVAKDILKQIAATNWTIGKAMAANAKFSLVGPGNEAADPIIKELAVNIKVIATCLALPVHWQGWTDLMSNRATAEELSNLVEIGTKKERLIWIEGITEVIRKMMVMAVDSGVEGSINAPDDFTIDMPFINKEKLKEILEVWLPLQQEEVIDIGTLRNKIPGINPSKIKKALEQLEKENERKVPDAVSEFEQFVQKEDAV